MSSRIMDIIARETCGRSYKAHKFCLDHYDRPMVDYREDRVQWQRTAETNEIRRRTCTDLTELSKELSKEKSLLTYFLDGSRHVYKVDDIAYQAAAGRTMIYPVVAGQIGVGCCKRVEKVMKRERLIRECVVSLPRIAIQDQKRGFIEAKTMAINECDILKNCGLRLDSILTYKTDGNDDKDYADRGTASIQDRMIAIEKSLVADLARENKINQDNYLVKDGSLEYRPTPEDKRNKAGFRRFVNNYNWVLGVSKSFNPEVCLDYRGHSNAGYIADLPLYHRTPVANYKNEAFFDEMEFAVWYVRIRDQNKTRTPFDGVLKVEKILVTDEEKTNGMDSDLVDQLSAYLINERNPVCYGSDIRWANHLYPIYQTELFLKSSFLSEQSFLNLF